MRCLLLLVLVLCLTSDCPAQYFRPRNYAPQYVPIPPKPKPKPQAELQQPAPIDEEAELQRIVGRLRRARIVGNVTAAHPAAIRERQRQRELRAERQRARDEYRAAMEQAAKAEADRQAGFDAIYGAAYVRASAAADARWEASTRAILLDALLRRTVPERHEVEIYEQPYYDGPRPMQPMQPIWMGY